MAGAASEPVARLRLVRMGGASRAEIGRDEHGEAVLRPDGTVTLTPDPDLRLRLLRAADRMDRGALFWGATLGIGLMTLGGLLVARDRRGAGLAAVGAAGAAALGGAATRRGAIELTRLFDRPLPARDLSVRVGDDSELTLSVATVPWAGQLLRFGPGEYDPAEARAFVSALEAAKAGAA